MCPARRKVYSRFWERENIWSEGVDDENGNYDYLMFADLDFDNPEVVREMQDWGIWVSNELNLDGMRLDAIKHMNDQFIKHFLER